MPRWIHEYNHHRPHTAIGGVPPITRLTNLPGQYIYPLEEDGMYHLEETEPGLVHVLVPAHTGLQATGGALRVTSDGVVQAREGAVVYARSASTTVCGQGAVVYAGRGAVVSAESGRVVAGPGAAIGLSTQTLDSVVVLIGGGLLTGGSTIVIGSDQIVVIRAGVIKRHPMEALHDVVDQADLDELRRVAPSI